MVMIRFIREFIFKFRFARAVNKAKHFHDITHRKYMVLVYKGKPEVFEKKKIRQCISNGIFRKGTTVRDIENMALYVTT